MCVPPTKELIEFVKSKKCMHDFTCLNNEFCAGFQDGLGTCHTEVDERCIDGKCADGKVCVLGRCMSKCFSSADCRVGLLETKFKCIDPSNGTEMLEQCKKIGFCLSDSEQDIQVLEHIANIDKRQFNIRSEHYFYWADYIPKAMYRPAMDAIYYRISAGYQTYYFLFVNHARYTFGLPVLALVLLCVFVVLRWKKRKSSRKGNHVPCNDSECLPNTANESIDKAASADDSKVSDGHTTIAPPNYPAEFQSDETHETYTA